MSERWRFCGVTPERRSPSFGRASCLNADSLPRAAAFNVGTRSAKRDIVSSGCLHDGPDRADNDLWLVDRHDVTGLLSDHQTASF